MYKIGELRLFSLTNNRVSSMKLLAKILSRICENGEYKYKVLFLEKKKVVTLSELFVSSLSRKLRKEQMQ